MTEPYAGGPGGRYQSHPGGRRQPDQPDDWAFEDWFRTQRDQEPGPGPREGERARGGRHRHGGRGPDLDETTVDQLAAPDPQWRAVGRNWALIAGLVFFVFDTFLMADGFARPVAMSSRVLVIFIWLVSLVALGLLWVRGSSRFAVQNPFVRTAPGAHQR